MAAMGKDSGYAERFMRTIKEEQVDLSEYRDLADANQQIGSFIQDVYMTKRIHSSLGYLPPSDFEESYWQLSKPAVAVGTPFYTRKKCPVLWVHHTAFRLGSWLWIELLHHSGVYHDGNRGDFTSFTCWEWITHENLTVYELFYHGGLVKD